MISILKKIVTIILITPIIMLASEAQAHKDDERFQAMFRDAGYTTAYGAALGLAVAGLTKKPRENLNYIYIGASLGFIGGSIFGAIYYFSPSASTDSDESFWSRSLLNERLPNETIIAIRPNYNLSKGKIDSVQAAWNIVKF